MHQERAAAVQHLVDEARRIEQNGVNYATLEKIGGLLSSLASRAELFPQDEFPLGADGGIYRLSEDPDHRFALYASAGGSAKKVPPHNHTTWAIIAGVHGAERNVVYERLDNGAQDGVVKLREAPAKEKTLRRGDFICYLPDDFHHIETPAGEGDALHLHFYGLSLEHLPDRVSVDMATAAAKRYMAKAKILTPLLSVQQVKAMLKSGEVFAFFDVREEGEFSTQGHPLFATPLPLSRLEPRALALLPDRHTRIVLMDGGEEGHDPQWSGRANRAAAKLSALGYTDLAVMKGGLKAWREAGCEVFSGVNVPSKAFGEVVEHDYRHALDLAPDLKARIDAGDRHGGGGQPAARRVPRHEHPDRDLRAGRRAGLSHRRAGARPRDPGGGELRRPHALDHGRAVADQCRHPQPGGRPAQRHHGLASRRPGARPRPDQLRARGVARPGGRAARRRARAVCARFEVPRSTARPGSLAGGPGPHDLPASTCARPRSFWRATCRASASAPGGQLVQATDRYIGTLRARLVLVDDDGVRAAMTASWLKQMALHEVAVLDGRSAGRLRPRAWRPVRGRARPRPARRCATARSRRPASARCAGGRPDAAPRSHPQRRLRAGHIAGAWHGVRTRLAA